MKKRFAHLARTPDSGLALVVTRRHDGYCARLRTLLPHFLNKPDLRAKLQPVEAGRSTL